MFKSILNPQLSFLVSLLSIQEGRLQRSILLRRRRMALLQTSQGEVILTILKIWMKTSIVSSLTSEDHFRKTFITNHQVKEEQKVITYTLHDIMIPAGWTAKLIRVPNPYTPDFRVSEVCDKLKFIEAAPVIILSGAWGNWAGKVLAGIAWAAFWAGAYIIDSGIGSGIEKFCMRKSRLILL